MSWGSRTNHSPPVQAALSSLHIFSGGVDALAYGRHIAQPVLVPIVSAASSGFLALLGAIGARAGGAMFRGLPPRWHFGGRWRWLSQPVLGSSSEQLILNGAAFVQILFRLTLAPSWTSLVYVRTSAFGCKADIGLCTANVCF